jgi:hypothetical protein
MIGTVRWKMSGSATQGRIQENNVLYAALGIVTLPASVDTDSSHHPHLLVGCPVRIPETINIGIIGLQSCCAIFYVCHGDFQVVDESCKIAPLLHDAVK